MVYGYSSSVFFTVNGKPVTNSIDVFFLLAIVFTVLKCMIGKHWSATLLAIVASPLYLFIPGVPLPFHTSIAVIVNGFIFDLYLRLGKEDFHYSRRHLILSGALGSFVMAAITLAVFRVFGPSFGINIPVFVYPIALVMDTFAGIFGVLLGVVIARRLGAEYAPLKSVKARSLVSVGQAS
jgi:hypothetical protein